MEGIVVDLGHWPGRSQQFNRVAGFRMRSSVHGAEGGPRWRCPLWFSCTEEGSPPIVGRLTGDEIHRLAPELTVLAPDTPGRRSKPGDLSEMTIADFVDSLVGDIESAGLEDIVIVAHSIGSSAVADQRRRTGCPGALHAGCSASWTRDTHGHARYLRRVDRRRHDRPGTVARPAATGSRSRSGGDGGEFRSAAVCLSREGVAAH